MNTPEIATILQPFVKSYAAWINPEAILYGGAVTSLWALILILCGIYRLYQLAKPSLGDTRMHILKALFYTFLDEFVIHRNLGRCKPEWSRWILHQMTLWGMTILAICTGIDAALAHEAITRCGIFFVKSGLYILATPHLALSAVSSNSELLKYLHSCGEVTHGFLESPVKIFYNVGAALFVTGTIGLLVRRRTNRYAYECVIGYDWYLLILLAIVAITGVIAEVLRMSAEAAFTAGNFGLALSVAYAGFIFFAIHLLSVLVLFVTIPFTKSAHVVYRFVALLLVNYKGIRKVEVTI